MENIEKNNVEIFEEVIEVENQLAENAYVEEEIPSSSEERRKLLEKTKIVKQTWSIQ